jgi:para-nitrobenzyl esterase
VTNLLSCPAATGLFGAAIVQSLPGTYFTPRLARDIAAELVASLGARATADALRDTDPGALAAAAAAVDLRMGPLAGRSGALANRWGPVAATPTPFSPVVDGDVLPAHPWTALAAGTARDVRVLVGHNRDGGGCSSWRWACSTGSPMQTRTGPLQAFGPGEDPRHAVRAAYRQATAEELFTLVQSDWLFRMPSLHLAGAQAAGGGQAYLYELTYGAPAAGGIFGACHALDIPLAFGTPTAAPHVFGEIPPEAAAEVSGGMRSAWVAMATDGHPGWPAFDHRRLTGVFDIGSTPHVQPYPEEASRALWSNHRFSTLDLLT